MCFQKQNIEYAPQRGVSQAMQLVAKKRVADLVAFFKVRAPGPPGSLGSVGGAPLFRELERLAVNASR